MKAMHQNMGQRIISAWRSPRKLLAIKEKTLIGVLPSVTSHRNYLRPTFSTKNVSLHFIEMRLKGHVIHGMRGTNTVHFRSVFSGTNRLPPSETPAQS